MRRAGNVKKYGFSVKTAEKTNFICPMKDKLASDHKNYYICLKTSVSGIEINRCKIAPKALYFPSKLHKIIISKAYNSAPNLSKKMSY